MVKTHEEMLSQASRIIVFGFSFSSTDSISSSSVITNLAKRSTQKLRKDHTTENQNRTPRQNVYACARLSISGLFFSHTFQSKSPARFILCAACGSVVLLYATRVFDYFVVIEIAFMDNQVQITETISRIDSEKVR